MKNLTEGDKARLKVYREIASLPPACEFTPLVLAHETGGLKHVETIEDYIGTLTRHAWVDQTPSGKWRKSSKWQSPVKQSQPS